jgi:CMP-N-acetylneuraminic acid synthetase
MINDLAIFLPCRAGSTRVRFKNTRPFAGRGDGLLGIKLDHLERLDCEGCLILDSNDPEVLEIGETRRRDWRGSLDLVVRERPDWLGQSSTTTDSLIDYALETIDAETLLWTHVTSPLVDHSVYLNALRHYAELDRTKFDSLMTVTEVRGFLWTAAGPLNYTTETLNWPRTQDLPAVYEVNSAIFLVDMQTGRSRKDRIGTRPYLMVLDEITAADIDEETDFRHAERLFGELCVSG